MKVSSKEGRSGFFKVTDEELTSTTATFKGGWGIITAKGATSYFDGAVDSSIEGGKALDVGCPVYIKAFSQVNDNPLEEGDTVETYDASVSCWTTDRNYSPSEGEVDVTSQCDEIRGKRDLRGDGNISESGSVSGYYETDSEMIDVMASFFAPVITDKDGKLTLSNPPKEKTLWTFLIIRETDTVGEIEKTIIRKQKISGLTLGSSQSGYFSFNYNYSTLESYEYRRKISA